MRTKEETRVGHFYTFQTKKQQICEKLTKWLGIGVISGEVVTRKMKVSLTKFVQIYHPEISYLR